MFNKRFTALVLATMVTFIALAACSQKAGKKGEYTLVATVSDISEETTSSDMSESFSEEEIPDAETFATTTTSETTESSSGETQTEVAIIPTSASEPAEASKPTGTPKPTDKPKATNTPKPTKTPETTTPCDHDWRLWTEWDDRDEYKCSVCGATMYTDKPEPTHTIPSPTPSPTPKPTEPVQTTTARYITGVDVSIHFWYIIDWEQGIDEERNYVVHNVNPDINWPASDTNAEKALVAEYGLDPEMICGIGGKKVIGAHMSDGDYYSYI